LNDLGDAPGELPTPGVDLAPGVATVHVTTGNQFTCALSGLGKVKCWGYPLNGQLGYGNTAIVGGGPGQMPPPDVDLGPGTDVVQLSAGGSHTCVVTVEGSVKCWGKNDKGQLGYGHTNDTGDGPGEMPPPDVDLGANVRAVQITAGGSHTCILTNAGLIKCWGSNQFGQLGLGNTNNIGDNETPDSLPGFSIE
jgi:alpha-tubulin suppressor-like RCC1 family protein